jgi:NADH-quinone oxidoreductase subunit M
MLWVVQRVFLGTLPEKWSHLTDMDGRETLMLASLAAIVIFFGIYPSPMLDLMNSSLNNLAGLLQQTGAATMLSVH